MIYERETVLRVAIDPPCDDATCETEIVIRVPWSWDPDRKTRAEMEARLRPVGERAIRTAMDSWVAQHRRHGGVVLD